MTDDFQHDDTVTRHGLGGERVFERTQIHVRPEVSNCRATRRQIEVVPRYGHGHVAADPRLNTVTARAFVPDNVFAHTCTLDTGVATTRPWTPNGS
jgi:hypothetical protein